MRVLVMRDRQLVGVGFEFARPRRCSSSHHNPKVLGPRGGAAGGTSDTHGLDALDGAALLDTVDEISIGGLTGHVSDMIGEEKAILAAIVVQGQTGWFFTLKAPADIAKSESDNFRSFLKSVKFK